MTQQAIDLNGVAEALLAELIAIHPSVFVGKALADFAPAMVYEIRTAFEAALAYNHERLCFQSECVCSCFIAGLLGQPLPQNN